MPALELKTIEDLAERLKRYLTSTGGFDEVEYLDAGGSAAVFRVRRGGHVRAVKAFDPGLLSGPGAAAERRRLELQRRLIGHTCPNLVQTFRADEAEGTAFVEMEFVEWPQLAKKIADIPDESIPLLISQLVNAVRFLESENIVHRDIKPENIHISADFTQLKLLDLGVAREFDSPEEVDAAITDHGNRRPFLATAQYSSPEYLFRLDAPTEKLWRGLNIYQVGAVLHDMIKREPIFAHEMGLGNRWLVARAVLTKQPSFTDADPGRLAALKALAMRCLAKDIEARLAIVTWDDFLPEGSTNPLESLRGRIAKARGAQGEQARNNARERIEFEQMDFLRRVSEKVRTELIGICGPQFPLTMRGPANGEKPEVQFIISAGKSIQIECILAFEWGAHHQARTANISVNGRMIHTEGANVAKLNASKLITAATIQAGEDSTVHSLSAEVARLIGVGLDRLDATDDDTSHLHATALI
jgi:serine/threonine-protein kinase